MGKEAVKVKTKNFMNFYFIKFLAQSFFLNKNDKLVEEKGKERSMTVLSRAGDKGKILSPHQE